MLGRVKSELIKVPARYALRAPLSARFLRIVAPGAADAGEDIRRSAVNRKATGTGRDALWTRKLRAEAERAD